MNVGLKILKTAFKSSLLATLLLYLVILCLNNEGTLESVIFFPIIFIILFILSTLGISFTIIPFYYLGKKYPLSKTFSTFFPAYAILSFSFCLLFYSISGIMETIVIFGIAYITSMFAWMWFFTLKTNKIIKIN